MRPIRTITTARVALVVMMTALMAAVLPGTPSTAAALEHPPPSTSTSPPVDMTVHGDSLVVVGDLTVAPPGSNAGARVVHDLAVSLHPAAVVLAGDLVHPASSLSQLNNTFDPVWGDQWTRIAPAIGNHDYNLGHSSGWASTGGGYFDYFGGNGGRARPTNASYYSFNVVLPQGGHWHVIVLNSACGDYSNPPAWVTPSGSLTGAMAAWLRADLADDTAIGELVVFHEPAFATPAPHAGKTAMRNLWWTMELRGVDLAVSGHNHAYERFAQQDHTGRRSTRGIRQVIVGTGGAPLLSFGSPVANSVVRDASHYGVLRLILRPDGWTQAFRTIDGASRDVVSIGCRP